MGDRKVQAATVAALLALAGATRLIDLNHMPAGVLPDEATHGYDAYSILQTGKDRWGQSWPVFLEGFGRMDYRPALYTYLVVPFVALLGPGHLVLAARVPAALCGVATIGCLYWLVWRTCGRRVAFWAALLLTLSPWHLHVSRYGHEASLTPLILPLALLTLSLAGWPLGGRRAGDTTPVRLRRSWMALFALVVGLSPYVYASLKLFVPAMLIVGALIHRRLWAEVLRRRENRFALLAGVAVFAIVITPMAWLTFAEWDKINARAQNVSLFHQGQALTGALGQCAANWTAHFGPKWLFLQGSESVLGRTAGVGQLNWYMLPLVPIGLAAMWSGRKQTRIYGILIAWLVLHPAASALTEDAPHMLRAACGLGSFQWIAAVGVGAMVSWADRRSWARWLIGMSLIACVAGNATGSIRRYYRTFGSDVRMLRLWQVDLRDALLSIRDRWRDYDHIFISDHRSDEHLWMSDHPYIHVLLFLHVDPAEFHAWEKRVTYNPPDAPFHTVQRMGPFSLSTVPAVLAEYFQDYRNQSVLFVVRPGDVDTENLRVLDVICDLPVEAHYETRFEIIELAP